MSTDSDRMWRLALYGGEGTPVSNPHRILLFENHRLGSLAMNAASTQQRDVP